MHTQTLVSTPNQMTNIITNQTPNSNPLPTPKIDKTDLILFKGYTLSIFKGAINNNSPIICISHPVILLIKRSMDFRVIILICMTRMMIYWEAY